MSEPSAGPSVAVVGMSGRFPGARDVDGYWRNLRDGVCSIVDFGTDELVADGVDADQVADRNYVRSKGYLADADRFEPELFGFTAAEASALDPQHRLLLETAWSALEDAGYDPRRVPYRTGVYVGGGPTEHMHAAHADRALAASLGAMQLRILTDREFLAAHVSYRLGLHGPSMTVQTACSTSLTATHLAVQALLLGECDVALAGGVSVDSTRRGGYVHYEGGIFAADGRCRPFDEKAAGTVPGNGVGVVVLRRLEDALADGDPVRAVVRGTAVTNDGAAKVGFTAPGVDQQTAAIAEAWSAAGLTPDAAQYVEMHGTGTELGDRIELQALAAALSGAGDRGIGSVKSNLGHLDAAAGVASLVKTVLMLENRTLVPTVNVLDPTPDLAGTGLRLVTEPSPWSPPDGGPLLAGVTSLGIGGTNVHVVLESAPPVPRGGAGEDEAVLALSARTEAQLRTSAGRLAAALRADGAPALTDVAHTLAGGRAELPVRASVRARSRADAAAQLGLLAAGGALPDAGTSAVPAGRRVRLPTYPFDGGRYEGLRSVSRAEPAASTEAGGDLATSVEDLLRETLGLEGTADLDRTYFEVGGDSLAAVHLTGRLRDDLGVEVPVELFLEELTLRELVARVVGAGTAGDSLGDLLDEIEAEP